MKAIINVKKGSAYSKFNGLTFDIAEMFKTGVSIKGLNPEFPDNKTDFGFSEVIIVDIQKEISISNEFAGCDADHRLNLVRLQNYCIQNGIKYSN